MKVCCSKFKKKDAVNSLNTSEGKKRERKLLRESFHCSVSASEAASPSGNSGVEVSTGSGGLVGLRWSTAAAALGRHAYVRTHARTHARAQGVRYITGRAVQPSLTAYPSSCVATFCPSCPPPDPQPPPPPPPREPGGFGKQTDGGGVVVVGEGGCYFPALARTPSFFFLSLSLRAVGVRTHRKSSRLQQETHSNLK